MIVVNYSHTLTEGQRHEIEALAGQAIARLVHVPTQFDPAQPYAEQVRALVDATPLSATDWQTCALLIVPPGHSLIAAALLAELHGRMGYFAAVVRVRPVAESTPPRFEVAELVDLQAVRDEARKRR